MERYSEHRLRRKYSTTRWIVICGVFLLALPGLAAEPVRSLAALREAISKEGRATLDVSLQGVVCAESESHGLVALQDGTATELLEVPSLPPGLKPGEGLGIEGHGCMVTRGLLAIQLGTAPVVELDGYHPPIVRTGSVDLEQGTQPLRVEWFNGFSDVALNIEWKTQGLDQQKLPPAVLWHDGAATGSFEPGLRFKAYEGESWYLLPDFASLTPLKEGVVTDFDLGVRSRPENCGLVLSGYLQVPKTGRYDFFLSSDDGSRLFVGKPNLQCAVLPEDASRAVIALPLASALAGGPSGQWVTAEGTVAFAARRGGLLDLELSDSNGTVPVTMADAAGFGPAAVLHRRVELAGVRRAEGIVMLDPAQLKVLEPSPDHVGTLTEAVEVRQLSPKEADQALHVDLRGVVTMVDARALVLQDATGGVFVHYVPPTSTDAPKMGELWRIEGRSGSGDFSPVVHAERVTYQGAAFLPKPARPTWEQLVSGSLDAEEVEIEGIVVSASALEVRLATRDGTVSISNDSLYPLPTIQMSEQEVNALVGSLVKFRGVYASSWDKAIRRVHPAELKLGNATLTVEEPAPADPFSAPLVQASGLLMFTSQSGPLKPVRVRGIVLANKPPEVLAFDRGQSFRIVNREPAAFLPGDEVEAVGFPRLGGPSPVLLEAQTRKTGTAALPEATHVPPERLPDARLDSTRVEIEATLLSDSLRQDERALELRSGSNRFFAYLPPGGAMPEHLERDSVLKLTGVYASPSPDHVLANPDPFELQMTGAEDVVILQRGPWWTAKHTIIVVSILSGGLILASLWVTVLRRTVAKRSKQLAQEIEERESVERHRIMDQERSRVAQDLHDELGSGLTEAGMISALLKNPAISQKVKDDYLKQLSGVCFSLVTGLDEIVWAVNPRYDSVADLAGYFSLFAQRFLGLAEIRCRLNIDDAIPALPLDPSRRHGIFLALKEALNNIARHSGATEVHLTIAVVEGELRISIADDGCGFDPATLPPGSDGVRGMQDRIAQLGGVGLVESAAGQGTTVRFQISLERSYP